LRNSVEIVFLRYEEFWSFCFSKCDDFKLGCARSCKVREQLDIPPFGKSYFAKLTGEVSKEES
jgi:hypothetical protein